ncbi:hypothetical protein N7501_010290 [Penicillium viridicatum]|nr:hypothetical protein N7501_010290 [Penicillium viridicatum]
MSSMSSSSSSSSPYQLLVQGDHARQPDKLPSIFISSTLPVVHENTIILGPHTLPSPPPTRKAMQTQLTAVEPAKPVEEYRSFQHGNLYEERKICLSQELLDSDELSPATVVSPGRMIDQFLIKARRASELAKKTSAPLLLMFCHGLPNFHLFLNNGDTKKGLSMVRLKGALELGVLAERVVCDYANLKEGDWVPVLAILCDGRNFEFLVYNSADKAIYSSGRTPGIVAAQRGEHVDHLISIKRTCEYLFDWFVMGCIALEDEICWQ